MQKRKLREGSDTSGESSSLKVEADPAQPRSPTQVRVLTAAPNKQNPPKPKKQREPHLNIGIQYLHSALQLIMLLLYLIT